MNDTNDVWKSKLKQCYDSNLVTKPRDQEIRELIAAQYKVQMPAFITLVDRKVNYSFMFAEAWWILSGSNRVSDIVPYMKFYKTFSDDEIFMRGAYGPKITDQLGYIVDTLVNDRDSRQAVLNIWRERPASSKDIPCTLSMQFFIRNNKLDLVTTMRSNDIVKGFTYDVFTFSMVAYSVILLLTARGVDVTLGTLYLNAGSLHLYESDYKSVDTWIKSTTIDGGYITEIVERVIDTDDYEGLLNNLKLAADGVL